MPQFDVSSFSSQLFWLSVVFAFLYFLVSKFIAPKAESILTARNRYIEENINHAQEYNGKVKSIEILKEEKLSEVNIQVENMQKHAMDTMDAHFNSQREELSQILSKKQESAIAEINEYVDKFHADESAPCVKLAAFIIKKITNNPADMTLLKKIHERAK